MRATTRFARAVACLTVPATAQRGLRSAAGAHLAAGRRAMGGPVSGAGGTFWGAVGANIGVKAPALIAPHQDLSMTYAELLGQATSFAGVLSRDLGYARGDKLAVVLGGNCAESVIVQLGAGFAGVTVVTAKDPADEKLVGCRGLVVSDHVLIAAQHPEGILAGEKHPPILCHDDTGVGSACANLFFQAVVDARAIGTPERDGESVHAIYNGAKPVSQANIVAIAQEAAMSLALKQSDRVCIPVPLAHPFGFGGALSVLMAGGTLVLPASTDPSLLVQTIEEEACSVFFADTHMIKKAIELDLKIDPLFNVRGVVKIGGGNAFGLGTPVEWSGMMLSTAGTPA
ncbi:hypothetical protein T484DRAFT_1948775 [Baffinella frigidus]|nr:hypothetical protein T484DRAFT_1948775 [Cryptophyta sp. CCMP2293]